MKLSFSSPKPTTRSVGRRNILQMAGAGVATIGLLATTACGTSDQTDAASTTAASATVASRTTPVGTGDVTAGADNFYTSDQVDVEQVTFRNQYQMEVAGTLFVPTDLDRTVGSPAMVVGHPMGAVREQSANLYATRMAEEGFVTLSLDLSFWGESEGEPRGAGAPDIYAEDFSAGVDFLRSQPFVDDERIGALGICGSASFVISAAKIDPRIKAVATVSMYDMGAANRDGLRNAVTPEQRQEILAQAAAQRDVEFAGGDTEYVGGTPEQLSESSTDIDREFYDFYRTERGYSPNTNTQPSLTSNSKFMNFYPFNDIETISPRPMLFIAGDQAHSLEFSEDAYQLAAEPKTLSIVPGAGHVDLYDRTDLIPFEQLAAFFDANLQ